MTSLPTTHVVPSGFYKFPISLRVKVSMFPLTTNTVFILVLMLGVQKGCNGVVDTCILDNFPTSSRPKGLIGYLRMHCIFIAYKSNNTKTPASKLLHQIISTNRYTCIHDTWLISDLTSLHLLTSCFGLH